jgi:hypothetical protein
VVLSLLLLVACAHQRSAREKDDQEIMSIYKPRWFGTSIEHSLQDLKGEPLQHLYFDTAPEVARSERILTAVITTPEDSKHAYRVDLLSGQRYYTHTYCAQSDIWKRESGKVGAPTFAVGYVPRILDQTGEPQKIIIFGTAHRSYELDSNYHRVRVVGGYIEKECPQGNCAGRDTWRTRLVLLGIDEENRSLDDVRDLASFRQRFIWSRVRATLENMDGRAPSGQKLQALVEVARELEPEQALDYMRKSSVFMTEAELKKIQTGCHKVYDRLWKSVGIERPEDRPAKTTDELNQKLKVKEDLRGRRLPVGRARRLHKFISKYSEELATCSRFVYHGNLNQDVEKFWFLNHMAFFVRLHREGYYFDCNRRAWQRNLITVHGDKGHELKTRIGECDEKDIDAAMGYLPNFLKTLHTESNHYYRFIDYDNHPHGTHRKLYSWVRIRKPRLDCAEKAPPVKTREDLYPEDVVWRNWDHVDIEDRLKIIQ